MELTIFDSTGKEVTKLVNELRSSGMHRIVWNAATKASGVYLYTVKTPSFSTTKKMILIK